MAIDLNLPLEKIIVKLNQLDDVLNSESELGNMVANLIHQAYTEGLTLGLAGSHDKMVYRAVTDYIVEGIKR